ncbi:transposase [Methylomonas sp. HYX-M1]|uniref:REP-associated tyrosine transposase n=1 Tax=Methylomonas sp. HYX-M1 TaxID=3139307 RepID=UPI00345C0649
MTEYRQFYISKAIWFFTVNLAERKNNHLLIDKIDELRNAFRYVKQRKPFHIDAIVILPDHLHCIWTLPPDDENLSVTWNMLKGRFSRSIDQGERILKSRQKRRERGVWQRQLWTHLIEDQDNYNRHVDYIHWNPVKHGHVKSVIVGLIQVFSIM